MAKTVVSFTLDSERDRDLVRWLERQENRSLAIREAIREHLERGSITIADVYEAVKNLERKLQARAVIMAGNSSPAGDDWDEPPEAVAALEALAEL